MTLAPLTTDDPVATGSIPTTMPNEPWWVVVASLADQPDRESRVGEVQNRLAACRLETTSAGSSNFAGFRAGYVAVVIGPIANREDASTTLGNARRCVPDANMRQARRLGD